MAQLVAPEREDWRRMVNTDFLGTLYGVQAVLPIMKAQGKGHIVNVSSGTGRWLFPSAPVYSGIKFAVSNLTEMLRQEVGNEHIRVTSIEPGAVRTEIFQHMNPKVREETETMLKQMTPLESEDIADAILYAVTRPEHVNVNILTVYPTEQTS